MTVNLFNAKFYSAANSDLAAAGITTNEQLLSHFQSYGLKEGRQFSPIVNLNFYRASNSDLAQLNNEQLFQHLQNHGVAEGRQFSLFFDTNFYRVNNSDLTGMNHEQLFEHLQNHGIAEGRRFSAFTDLYVYREKNQDLARFDYQQLLQHLQLNGLKENRQFSQFFDPDYYRENNSDLAGLKREQLLEHFRFFGLNESRQFSKTVNLDYYRSFNSDLQNLSNKQLYEHLQIYGLNERRMTSPAFDVQVYLANNSDLVAAGFNGQQAYTHFIVYGQNEGRPGSDYAGNNQETARIISQNRGSVSFTDFVGGSDTLDYYRVVLPYATNATIKVDNLQGNADVKIYHSQGSVIALSSNTGNTTETLNGTLEAGTYYVEVSSVNNANTYYNVTLSALSPLNSAVDVGNLSSTPTVKSDYVSFTEFQDFYRFNLNASTTVNTVLNNLSADGDLTFIWDVNNNGEFDSEDESFSSNFGGTIADKLKGLLPAGNNYYIWVRPYATTRIDYTLNLSTEAPDNYALYDGLEEPGTLASDKVLEFNDFNFGGIQKINNNDITNLTTNKTGMAGYRIYSPVIALDRNAGFSIRFQIKLNSESHGGDINGDNIADHAGFNLTAVTQDMAGIEIGFWNNEIWAKDITSASGSPLMTHSTVERAMRDTTALTNYELSVLGDTYQLFADGSAILKGKLKDYSALGGVYSFPDYLFFGDNSGYAMANTDIQSIYVTTVAPELSPA
jgi:Bacterial pre-peptidase C-terminal domain